MNVLLKKGELLDKNGCLNQEGFSFEPIVEYRKSAVTAPLNKLKEWDYYQIYNEHYALILSISDLSTKGIFKVSYYNFDDKEKINKVYMVNNPYGNICMPTTSKYQDIKYDRKNFSFEFISNIYDRKLIVLMKNFKEDKVTKEKKDFYCVINLFEQIDGSSVSVRSFKESNAFAYNQKISCMSCDGFFKIGDEKFYFYKANTTASLDWMRAVLPDSKISFTNAIMHGYTITKKEIGFNITTNYGNDNVNENMFFFDKKAFKLDNCEILVPTDPYGNKLFKSVWTIKTDVLNVKEDINEEKNEIYKELFIEFEPFMDDDEEIKENKANINVTKIFGKFKGYIYFNEHRIVFQEMIGCINLIDLKM